MQKSLPNALVYDLTANDTGDLWQAAIVRVVLQLWNRMQLGAITK
jgi:hypothetical protein